MIDPKRGAFDRNQNTIVNVSFAMSEYQSNTYQDEMLEILRHKKVVEKKMRKDLSKKLKYFEKMRVI